MTDLHRALTSTPSDTFGMDSSAFSKPGLITQQRCFTPQCSRSSSACIGMPSRESEGSYRNKVGVISIFIPRHFETRGSASRCRKTERCAYTIDLIVHLHFISLVSLILYVYHPLYISGLAPFCSLVYVLSFFLSSVSLPLSPRPSVPPSLYENAPPPSPQCSVDKHTERPSCRSIALWDGSGRERLCC